MFSMLENAGQRPGFPSSVPSLGHEKAHTDRATTILKDIRDWTIDDMYGAMLKQQPGLHAHPVLGGIAKQPHYLLRHHPMRCGMLKYDVYLQLYATGTGVENQVLMMSMLAHLYAACRSSYREDPVWPDMEFMMERQDKSRLFLGGQPKTFKEASRKLVLAGGASVSNFARRRRDDKVIIDPDNTQYLQDRSVLGTLYQERMYREPSTSEATDLTRKLIQTIKSSSRASKRVSRVGNLISTQSSNLNRDWRPLEVMEELRKWLVEDAIDLYWDWHCMNQSC
jgi:hypothetical protein